MKKLMLFLLVLCVGIGCTFAACADVYPDSNVRYLSDKEISLSFSFADPLVTSAADGDSIDIAGLTNVPFTTAELPNKHVQVLLPYGTTVKEYTVASSKYTTIEDVHLPEPAPVYPISDDSTPYPASDIAPTEHYSEGGVQMMRGFAMFSIDLHPVTYNGTTLTYAEDLTLDIKLEPEDYSDCYQPSYIDTDMLPKGLYCEDFLSTYPLYSSTAAKKTLLGTGRVDYVIITKSSLVKYFDPLIKYKRAKGLSAKTVTTESIYKAYKSKGRDNAERIRCFLQDAYKYNRIRYVLLGGDADADSSSPTRISYKSTCIVPTRILYCHGDYIASDMYYGCLDGTFDYNRNGYYGESVDGISGWDIDFLYDVYVGRAPVNNATEAKNFVSKTIAYEKRTKSKTALMVGEKLDSYTYGMNYMEEIRKGATTAFRTQGLPSTYKSTLLYDKNYYAKYGKGWSYSSAITQLNKSPEQVHHLGHANNTYLMKMSNSSISKIKNSKSFFLYSQGCYPGSFDNMTSSRKYTSSDSFAEQLIVKHSRYGAVACIANSRYGWYAKYNTQGPSQYYHRCFAQEYALSPSTSVGALLAKSKHDMYCLYLMSKYYRYCYYEVNLLGDPEMSLYETYATLGKKYSADMEKNMYPAVKDAVDTPEGNDIPQTGDSSSLAMYLILLAGSVAGLVIVLNRRKAGRDC